MNISKTINKCHYGDTISYKLISKCYYSEKSSITSDGNRNISVTCVLIGKEKYFNLFKNIPSAYSDVTITISGKNYNESFNDNKKMCRYGKLAFGNEFGAEMKCTIKTTGYEYEKTFFNFYVSSQTDYLIDENLSMEKISSGIKLIKIKNYMVGTGYSDCMFLNGNSVTPNEDGYIYQECNIGDEFVFYAKRNGERSDNITITITEDIYKNGYTNKEFDFDSIIKYNLRASLVNSISDENHTIVLNGTNNTYNIKMYDNTELYNGEYTVELKDDGNGIDWISFNSTNKTISVNLNISGGSRKCKCIFSADGYVPYNVIISQDLLELSVTLETSVGNFIDHQPEGTEPEKYLLSSSKQDITVKTNSDSYYAIKNIELYTNRENDISFANYNLDTKKIEIGKYSTGEDSRYVTIHLTIQNIKNKYIIVLYQQPETTIKKENSL